MPLLFFCHRKQLVPFCVIRNFKEFPMTQKSRESSTDRGFLCYTYRSIRPARSVFHAHKYDSTSYTCRSSSYSSAWLYSDASDLSPFSLYSLIPDRNYLFMNAASAHDCGQGWRCLRLPGELGMRLRSLHGLQV